MSSCLFITKNTVNHEFWFLILYKEFTVHLYTFGDNLYLSPVKIVQDFLLTVLCFV